MVDHLVHVAALLVDRREAEERVGGVALLLAAELGDEVVRVLDRLVVVADALAVEDRVVHRLVRVLLAGVLAGVLLEHLRGALVVGDPGVDRAEAGEGLGRGRAVGELLAQRAEGVDGGRQRAALLVADAGVVQRLVELLLDAGVGVGLDRVVEDLEVAVAALHVLGEVAGLLGLLLDLLEDLALGDREDLGDALADVAAILVLLGGEELGVVGEPLGPDGDLVVLVRDDVDVEDRVGRVVRGLVLGVVLDDVLEQRRRLVELVVPAVHVRLEELHPDQLGVARVLDVVDVDVERVDHLLLALGDRLGLGDLLRLGLVVGAHLDRVRLHPRIDRQRVLPAEDGGVGRLLLQLLVDLAGLDHVGERDRGVLPQLGLHARVGLGVGPRPQQLGVEVLLLAEVLGVGEDVEVDVVELVGVGQRLGVLGPQRLAVVRGRHLTRHRRGVVVALAGLGRRQHLLVVEHAVELGEQDDLLDLVGVGRAGGREHGLGDVVLPQAHVLVLGLLLDELAVGVDRAIGLALLDVEVGQDLVHDEGVRAVDLLEGRPGLLDLAELGEGADEVLLRGPVEGLHLLVAVGVADDLEELLPGVLVLAHVEVDPPQHVVRVGVDLGLREQQDLLVESLGVLELLGAEVVVGEGQVGLGHELRLRVVGEQPVVDGAGVLHVLRALQRVREVEERLVHVRVVLELVVVGQALVGLDRVLQRVDRLLLVVRGRVFELLLLGGGLGGVGLDGGLGALEPVVPVELGVGVRQAEVEVGLLGHLGVGRRLDQVLEQVDLLLADVADLALDLEELVRGHLRRLGLVVLDDLGPRALGQLGVDLDLRRPCVLGLRRRLGARGAQAPEPCEPEGDHRQEEVTGDVSDHRAIPSRGGYGVTPREAGSSPWRVDQFLGQAERTLNR